MVVLPEFGAKVVSLFDRATGREWLTQPEGRTYAHSPLEVPYEESDRSGWDECFPSVGSGRHPTPPWHETPLADHGELWQRAWRATLSQTEVLTEIDGVRFAFRFRRRLSVSDDTLEAAYRVENVSNAELPCVWSMHPLFAAGQETRLLLPDGALFRAETCFGGALPAGRLTPHEVEQAFDLGAIRACKLYCDTPPIGRAALYDEVADAWVGLAFELEDVPFLGVWLNRGGWPSDEPLHHVALEPTTGAADELATALRNGGGTVIAPKAHVAWRIVVRVGSGRDDAEAFVRH